MRWGPHGALPELPGARSFLPEASESYQLRSSPRDSRPHSLRGLDQMPALKT